MNKMTKDMMPDAFESLLLETIVSDFNTNIEIQKSVDMNANYISSMPIDLAIEHQAKEKIEQIINSNKKPFLYYFKIVLMISIVGIISYFAYQTLTNTSSTPLAPSNPSQNTLPIVSIDTTVEIETETIDTAIIAKQNQFNIPKSNNKQIETFPLEEETEKYTNSEYGSASIPKPYYGSRYVDDFDPEYANDLHPDGDDPLKVVVGDYQLNGYIVKMHPWSEFDDDGNRIISGEDDNNIKYKELRAHTSIPIYSGIPFKKGLENVSYISINESTENNKVTIQDNPLRYLLPEGLKYYFNIETLYEKNYSYTEEQLDKLQPFYISNTEIRNIDYREFLRWVLKYNGKDNIKELYDLSEDELQYFTYSFHNPNPEYEATNGNSSINVFPQNDCWTSDFKYSYNEPMSKMYFWHPAYNEYPVVGVSYWQALAYLDWLTWVWQTRLDEQNINYEITFDLPYDYEWELASEKILESMAIYGSHDNIICDLDLENKGDIEFRQAIGLYTNDYSVGSFFTSPVSIETPMSPENKTDIKNLEGNVSEWLKESYSASWKDFRVKYIKDIEKHEKPGYELLLATEEYFNRTRNNVDGKLVRGANWFDNRQTDRTHFVSKSLFAKCYASPSEQHSTLGFRYVVRVRLKDENKSLKKTEVLGRNMPVIDYTLLKIEHKKNFTPDPEGFKFIPPGSFNYKDTTVSIQGFWGKETEVCNLSWMIFLNYLIESNRVEDLAMCIPNDPQWKIKMNLETDTVLTKRKFDKTNLYKYLPFTKKFMLENNIKDIPVTYFAFEPIVGISYDAARLFGNWLSRMSNSSNGYLVEYRLPHEAEFEYMARGGLNMCLYPWGGPYTRNYKGQFLAKYRTSNTIENEIMIDSTKIDYTNETALAETIENQNPEFTKFVSDSSWYSPNSPSLIGNFPENNWGLYEVAGNAAEMINVKTKTKGGSWASGAYFIQIENEEKWDGSPSDCVGFRIVRTFLLREREGVE